MTATGQVTTRSRLGTRVVSLSLVVPLFNEEDRVRESLPRLVQFIEGLATGSELILVDDGSSDATAATVTAYLAGDHGARARLIRRPHQGKGAAVRAGLSGATANFAGFCDVDLSTPLEHLRRILVAALMAPVLAIGSRDVAASRLLEPEGRGRETLGKAYNRLLQLSLTPGVADTQCGAKIASTELWRAVLPYCREDGWTFDVEAIAIARRLGFGVQEVAIDWHHDRRSRIHLGRDGAAMVWAVPRMVRALRRVPTVDIDREASEVLDTDNATALLEADSTHWWFRSKASFVASALRRHLSPRQRDGYLLDVGAGSGGVTSRLGWQPGKLLAADGSEMLLRAARAHHALMATRAAGDRLPLRPGAVTVATLLDVIEHLQDPAATLAEVWRTLDDDGLLVVTVPAHQWLWSGADEVLGHVRRYTMPLLRERLRESGFQPVFMSHVFSWLVPPVWLQRRMTADKQRQLGLDQTSPIIDRAALVLSRIERAIVRAVPLPVGTTILCVARKTRPGPQPAESQR